MVWQVANTVKIPVIGMGGIMNAGDALEFFMAGADAVQIGTASFTDPQVSVTVLEGIGLFHNIKGHPFSECRQFLHDPLIRPPDYLRCKDRSILCSCLAHRHGGNRNSWISIYIIILL
jgi:tRNA-dihydrouridine synthase